MKYMLLLMMALLVDGLQFVLGWMAFVIGLGLQALTPIGGGVAGAGAGAYFCWDSTLGVWTAALASAKCAVAGGALGAASSAFGVPFGTALGFGLEIVVSITMGGALILALVFNGMYYKTRIFGNVLIEMMPGVSIIPAWTFMVILCILRERAEEGKLEGKASSNLAKMVAPGTALGTAVGGLKMAQQQKVNAMQREGVLTEGTYKQQRVNTRVQLNTDLRNVDGIKPAAINPLPTKSYVPKTA